MLDLTNQELYERMRELKSAPYPMNHEKAVRNFQETDFCRELRRRAEADKEFEAMIPVELLPAVFPERFKEAS